MRLKETATSGVKWAGSASVAVALLQLTQTAILARLLEPKDFGLVAIISVIFGFLQSFSDAGISAAIVHRQEISQRQLSTLYIFNFIIGLILFFGLAASSPIWVAIYKEQVFLQLVPLAATSFLLFPLGQQFQILLQKELRFEYLAIVDVISILFSVVVAVAAALAGQGVSSLIYAQLSNAGLRAILLVSRGWTIWRPDLYFCWKDMEGFIQFGLYQMGERALSYFISSIDRILIGTFLGTQELGYFQLAWSLVIYPVTRINQVFNQVSFPVFAKIQSDIPRLRNAYFRLLRMVAMVNSPVMFILSIVAPTLIPAIFGDQWHNSIALVQVLAYVALLRSFVNPTGALLLAVGRADIGFVWNAALFVTQTLGVALGVHFFGLPGVSAALLILQIGYVVPGYVALLRPILGPCSRDYVSSVLPFLCLSLLTAASVWVATHMFLETGFRTLFVGVSIGTGVYLLLNLFFQRPHLAEIRDLVLGR